jgi:patatin-like phospholipase/acyl hydrolase
MYRVLSIDGGGVRGLVAALVLADLEKRADRPVAELFDLVAATSTGAIIGLGLLRPGADGRPARTAAEVAEFYLCTSRAVFSRSPWHRIRSLEGLLGPKYDAGVLDHALKQEFGEIALSQTLRDVVITSYDLRARRPFFFKSRDVVEGRAADQPMWLVARSSSAAPTYFVPAATQHRSGRRWLVDGGVFANNPTLCALVESRPRRHLDGKAHEEVLVVSVGTGAISENYATPRTLRGGSLTWARPLFDIVLDGQEDSTDYQMRQLAGHDRYFRFQAQLPDQASAIDDASSVNVARLRDGAAELVGSRAADLEKVAHLLSTPAKAVT